MKQLPEKGVLTSSNFKPVLRSQERARQEHCHPLVLSRKRVWSSMKGGKGHGFGGFRARAPSWRIQAVLL